MMRLRWKLLAAMVALVAVTIGLAAAFTRRVTHDQVHRLLVARPQQRFDEVAQAVEAHVRIEGGWKNVDAVLDRFTDTRVIVVDNGGAVIAVSPDLRGANIVVDADDRVKITTTANGAQQRIRLQMPPVPLRDASGRAIGRAYVMPADEAEPMTAESEIADVDRRLLALFGIATLVALALTALLSRRITRPIEQLTTAVHEMGRGGVPVPVRVGGRDEIARLATAFNTMASTIATQEELRKRMTSDVAHELRTPLTNLRAELEAIEDGLAPPDAPRIASLHEEVVHLQRLVDDLQELAVAEAGALRLQRERIELGAAISKLVAGQADVVVEDEVTVEADATRVRQIVQNLLANALRHTPADARVRVTVGRDGDRARVAIRDAGPGIPAAELERIFERFYRVDEARSRDHGGSGLGLAIVRRLVELHGGRVWAESVQGQGATFIVTLPRASS